MSLSRWLWSRKARLARWPVGLAAYRLAARWLIPEGKVITLRRGPAAGCRWMHYGRYPLWMTIGCYEPQVADLVAGELKPGDVFYDVGASAGYFTLVAARTVGPDGHVAAFDPLPPNAAAIREQVRLNGYDSRCRVEELALARGSGETAFVVPRIVFRAHLLTEEAGIPVSDEGTVIKVRTTSLDEYANTHRPPTLVKMDIEGAEVQALEGASSLMSRADRPHWIIATHSDQLREEVEGMLRSAGYRTSRLATSEDVVYTL